MFKFIRIAVLLLILAFITYVSLTWLKINKTQELDIEKWQDGIAVAEKDGKYGYVNEDLKPIINYQYDIAKPFINERAITGIKFGNQYKYRLIDKQGNYIGEFYDEIMHLGDDIYRVRNNIKGKNPNDDDYYAWQMMDSHGKIISHKTYTLIDTFFDGVARVCIKDKCGFIDKMGRQTIRMGQASNEDRIIKSFDYSSGELDTRTGKNKGFSHGLVKNTKDGLIGFIDKNGKTVIPHQFTDAQNFSNGLAIVSTDKGIGVINTQGDFIVYPNNDYKKIEPFDKNVAVFQQGEYYGLIDNTGKTIIPTQREYTLISKFSKDNIAIVKKDDLYGFIDITGKEIIAPMYETTWGSFEDGRARVSKKGDENHIWHINKDNQIIGKETLTIISH